MRNKMRFDQIIVIDVESTCWHGKIPKGQMNEIIEIGICIICTKSGDILDTRDIIVKPEHSTISDYCKNLTTITQEQMHKSNI